MLPPFDKRLLAALECDLPITHRPFRRLARDHGLGESELIDALLSGLRSGAIRRYGALLAHRAIGFQANAMIVWQVPEDRVEEVGAALSGDPRVTHCYERPAFEGFPYNVYAMIHAATREEALAVVEELAQLTGVERYEVLFSVREFKKESPTYAGWPD